MKAVALYIAALLTVSPLAYADQAAKGNAVYDQHSQLSVANINRTTEILRDPTVAADNLKKSLAQVSAEAKNKLPKINASTTPGPVEDLQNADDISDPTRMTGSFRSTLQQMRVRTTTRLDSTNATPALPKVSLAAIVYGDADNASAMLHVNERTVLVRVGDKASFLDNGEVIEVVVQKINRNDLWLMVYPSRQIIVLR